MSKHKNCPNCDNQGFNVVQNHWTGEPEQEQCRFCYEEPDSIFNVIVKLEQENQQLKASINKAKADAVREFCNDLLRRINWDLRHYGKRYADKLERGEV